MAVYRGWRRTTSSLKIAGVEAVLKRTKVDHGQWGGNKWSSNRCNCPVDPVMDQSPVVAVPILSVPLPHKRVSLAIDLAADGAVH